MRKRKPATAAVEEARSFRKGSGGDAADAAVEARPNPAHHAPEAPHTRPARPLREHEKHDQMAEKEKVAENRQEALLDEGIEESFPGSDPVSANHFS